MRHIGDSLRCVEIVVDDNGHVKMELEDTYDARATILVKVQYVRALPARLHRCRTTKRCKGSRKDSKPLCLLA